MVSTYVIQKKRPYHMSIGCLQEVRTMENYKTIRSKLACGCL